MNFDRYKSLCELARAMEPDALEVLHGHAAGLSAPKSAALIAEACDGLKDMLLRKNAAYGDSATRPIRLMSKASPVEQILVRIDDKLSRLARGEAAGEDVEHDLLGYFLLLRVARTLEAIVAERKGE